MRLTESMIGKLVIRTRCLTRSNSTYFGGTTGTDTSFTHNPILVEAIENGILFYRHDPLGKLSVLTPDYLDEHWAEFPEKYKAEFWRSADEDGPVTLEDKK